ncbi:MAG TPA: phage baseplate assembly protein V [Ornithinibacter sp.]|nr:phage baseplate assembly protein V [Ornithinibacter sp.]
MGRSRDVYRAVVDENHDPQRRGRLQVSVPSLGVSSTWAEACLPPVPMVLLALPTVGSTVWVQFENGDRSRPVWTGIVWETALAADPAVTSAASLRVRAPLVTVEAGSTEFAGVVKCQTLIAEAVISTSYTPGVGNIS